MPVSVPRSVPLAPASSDAEAPEPVALASVPSPLSLAPANPKTLLPAAQNKQPAVLYKRSSPASSNDDDTQGLRDYDDDLSDDEDDYSSNFRKYFRVKGEEELSIAAVTVEELHAKRGRNTRLNATKTIGKPEPPSHVIKGLAVWEGKYRKYVSLSLQPGDIDEDLLAILGLTAGAFEAAAAGAAASGTAGGSKRRRGPDGGSHDFDNNYPSDSDGSASGSAGPDRAGPPVSRRGRGDGSNQNKLFMRHANRKGWVTCRLCRRDVWPPNCTKHMLKNCPARNKGAAP